MAGKGFKGFIEPFGKLQAQKKTNKICLKLPLNKAPGAANFGGIGCIPGLSEAMF